MIRTTIYISFGMAFSALLFPPFVDQARAACDPPKDVSTCLSVPKDIFAQASPALPEPPFLVTYPHTRNALVLTYSDLGIKSPIPAPGNNNCSPPSNVSGCAWVSSVHLSNSAIAKNPAPFMVRFQDGRSLLASPMPKH
jgi:hypothetical protein